MKEPIVSTNWLKENFEEADLIILDAGTKPVGTANLKNIQIKNARFFDLKNEFRNTTSNSPNTLPSPQQFETACQKMGINTSSKIVVYDHAGMYVSPRVWWMFKVMGHKQVAVLNGGFAEWLKCGYETEASSDTKYEQGNFKAKFQSSMFRDYQSILSNTKTNNAIVLDARSEGRFNGTAPEPRQGLKSGHIPGSFNLPYENVLNNGKFKSKAELASLFKDYKNETKPLVFSCGSGITACITLLASELVLKNEKAVYDGSWTEWAEIQNLTEPSGSID